MILERGKGPVQDMMSEGTGINRTLKIVASYYCIIVMPCHAVFTFIFIDSCKNKNSIVYINTRPAEACINIHYAIFASQSTQTFSLGDLNRPGLDLDL